MPEQVEAVAGPSRESDPPRVPSTVTPSRQVQQPSQAGTSARNLGQPTMPAEADPQRVPSTATPSRQSQQPSRAGTPARNLSQPTMPATFNTSNSFKIGNNWRYYYLPEGPIKSYARLLTFWYHFPPSEAPIMQPVTLPPPFFQVLRKKARKIS